MKKLAVTVTLAVATLASSSAAFADEINTDVVTTDKQAQPAQPAQPVAPSTTTTVTSPTTDSTVTTSQTTTTSAPFSTPTDRPTYELKENRRPNRPLLITGGSIFAGSYATTIIATAANDSKPDRSLYIPVVGPWLHLADRDGTEGHTGETLLIGASGVLQGAGIAIMIVSAFVPEKRSVGTISAGPVKMMVGPGGAAGTF
jgi:hypothetical protein